MLRPAHTFSCVVIAGTWEFPGGKIEAGESVRNGAARELREEVGLDIPYHKIHPATFTTKWFPTPAPPTEMVLMLLCTSAVGGVAVGLEGQPVAWVDPHELLSGKEYKTTEVSRVYAQWVIDHLGPDGQLKELA